MDAATLPAMFAATPTATAASTNTPMISHTVAAAWTLRVVAACPVWLMP
jgi:hypothetical protein